DERKHMASEEGGSKGSGPIIIGVILLLGAAGGILWWVNHRETPPTPPPVASGPVDSGVGGATTIDPPALDLPVASGPDMGPPETGGKAPTGGPYNACPATCSGGITDAIKQAAAARAGTAKQCYKTALEGNESLAGQIDISLRIGLNGETCAASIVS